MISSVLINMGISTCKGDIFHQNIGGTIETVLVSVSSALDKQPVNRT